MQKTIIQNVYLKMRAKLLIDKQIHDDHMLDFVTEIYDCGYIAAMCDIQQDDYCNIEEHADLL